MTINPDAPAASLPQPPRPEGAEPTPAPASQQEPTEAGQVERKRITLTVARNLASRAGSAKDRYVALVTAMNEVGIDGTEGPGYRGQLNEAFVDLRDAAESFDAAVNKIQTVASELEEL